ncbi:hypothetical protein BZG36_02922 [Bifiguratus adelaidae]|uniref:HMG box domain-containing protein n=1 Tax=Bifiguratus adelaidae TaxID=1938954 RepID=A0A261Y1D6_9FUNG|nr:hypothetical protein BZG36_02922 [Bifiguratus adelaidae]
MTKDTARQPSHGGLTASQLEQSQVKVFLCRLSLDQYVDRFLEEGFDSLKSLIEVTEHDLAALDVKRGHRRLLQRQIANIKGIPSQVPLLIDPNYEVHDSDARASVVSSALGHSQTSVSGSRDTSERFSTQLSGLSDESMADDHPRDDANVSDVTTTRNNDSTGQHGQKRKYRRHAKPDQNAPVKPPSAYVMFSNKIRSDLRDQSMSFTDLAKIVADRWKALPKDEKDHYETVARKAKDEYMQLMAEYETTDEHKQYQGYLADFKAKQESACRTVGKPRKRTKYSSVGSSSGNGSTNGSSSNGNGSSGNGNSESTPSDNSSDLLLGGNGNGNADPDKLDGGANTKQDKKDRVLDETVSKASPGLPEGKGYQKDSTSDRRRGASRSISKSPLSKDNNAHDHEYRKNLTNSTQTPNYAHYQRHEHDAPAIDQRPQPPYPHHLNYSQYRQYYAGNSDERYPKPFFDSQSPDPNPYTVPSAPNSNRRLPNPLPHSSADHTSVSLLPYAQSVRSQPAHILKKPANAESDKNNRLKWDEDNLMITEAQKDSTMKVNEPKTPFIKYNHETDEVMNMDSIPALNLPKDQRRGSSASSELDDFSISHSDSDSKSKDRRRVSVSDDDWDSPEEEDEEAIEHHKEFAEHRSKHYNMREAMRRARELLKEDEESQPPIPQSNGRYSVDYSVTGVSDSYLVGFDDESTAPVDFVLVDDGQIEERLVNKPQFGKRSLTLRLRKRCHSGKKKASVAPQKAAVVQPSKAHAKSSGKDQVAPDRKPSKTVVKPSVTPSVKPKLQVYALSEKTSSKKQAAPTSTKKVASTHKAAPTHNTATTRKASPTHQSAPTHAAAPPEKRKLLQSGSAFTYYWIASPSEYTGGGSVALKTCSGKTIAHVNSNYAQNIRMEGTGFVGSEILNLGNCNCGSGYSCFQTVNRQQNPYGLTAYDSPLRPFITVASNDLPRNTKIYVPSIDGWTIPGSSKKHNGCLLVDDQSWSFGGHHIDWYVLKEQDYTTLNTEHQSINTVDIYEGGNTCANGVEQAVVSALRLGPIPKHVGIIMDGNRRYATARRMAISGGHYAGYKQLEKVLQFSMDLGVEAISLYAFSIENYKRPKQEVDYLMKLFKEQFVELSENSDLVRDFGIKVKFVGNMKYFDTELVSIVERAEEMTKHHSSRLLQICCPYTSRDEMTTAVKMTVENNLDTGSSPLEITHQDITRHIMPEAPPLDILIRTSGEIRLSDFLLWQCHTATQIQFVDCYWPEFNLWAFLPALLEFQWNHKGLQRERAIADQRRHRNRTTFMEEEISEMQLLYIDVDQIAFLIMKCIRSLSELVKDNDHYTTFAVDIYGVLHNGSEPYPESVKAIRNLTQKATTILLSNSSRTGPQVADDLERKYGIQPNDYTHIVTSGDRTRHFLTKVFEDTTSYTASDLASVLGSPNLLSPRTFRDRFVKTHQFYLLGTPEWHGPLYHHLNLTPTPHLAQCDFILLGAVPNLPNQPPIQFTDETSVRDHYRAFLETARSLNIPIVCANPDVWAPHAAQLHVCSGYLAEWYAELGGTVLAFGKPFPNMYASLPEGVICIGDNINTDVKGAANAGEDVVLIAGGVHWQEFKVAHAAGSVEERVKRVCEKAHDYRVVCRKKHPTVEESQVVLLAKEDARSLAAEVVAVVADMDQREERTSEHASLALTSTALTDFGPWATRMNPIAGGVHVADALLHFNEGPVIGADPDQLFYFVQISDLHISRHLRRGNILHFLHFLKTTLPILSPPFVLATGDLTDAKDARRFTSHQYLEEWVAYKTALEESDVLRNASAGSIPRWVDVRGNHDMFNVEEKGRGTDYFSEYGVLKDYYKKNNIAAFDWKLPATESSPESIYKFVCLDASPRQGPSRPFNFFGYLDTDTMDALEEQINSAIASGTKHIILSAHYPTATLLFGRTSSGKSFTDLSQFISVFMSGHLHKLFGGLGDNLKSYHPGYNFLELELGDMKDHAMYRIMAVDHDILSFVDPSLPLPEIPMPYPKGWSVFDRNMTNLLPQETLPSPPVVLVTNPKDARYLLPNHEPSQKIKTSTHIRMLVFCDTYRLPPKIKVTIDGEDVPGQIEYKGRGRPAGLGSDFLPLYVLPWDPSQYDDSQNHVIEVIVTDADGKVGTATQFFRLDSQRIVEKGVGPFIIKSDFSYGARFATLLFMGLSLVLLLGPKLYLGIYEALYGDSVTANPLSWLMAKATQIRCKVAEEPSVKYRMAYYFTFSLLFLLHLPYHSPARWYALWTYTCCLIALPWFYARFIPSATTHSGFGWFFPYGLRVDDTWIPSPDPWVVSMFEVSWGILFFLIWFACVSWEDGLGRINGKQKPQTERARLLQREAKAPLPVVRRRWARAAVVGVWIWRASEWVAMTITAADNYYGVICNSSMEHCHCDFRLNIYDCIEASIFRGINIGKIGLCAVNVVLGASILGYRCGFRGYRIWDLRDLGLRGILRPRPVECMILFATSFNFLRLLNAGFLLAGYSGTYIVRAFLFELPWQLGFSALAIYLMGVTTTLSGSHKIKKETWLPHAELLDYVVAFFLFSPFITNNACAILAGYFADTGNKIGFDITTRMLYVLWSVYCFTLDVVVWLFGMRLIRVLKEHLAEFREDNSPRYRVLSFNMTKLRIVLVATFICLFSFIVVLLSYSIWRTAITTNTIASTIWAVLWEYVGSISTFLILCALAMSPVQPKGSSQSNSSKPTNNPGSSTNAMTTESSQFSSMQNDSNTTGISCAGRDDLYIPMRNIDTLGMKPNSADYVRRSGPDGISSDLGMAQYQYYQQKHDVTTSADQIVSAQTLDRNDRTNPLKELPVYNDGAVEPTSTIRHQLDMSYHSGSALKKSISVSALLQAIDSTVNDENLPAQFLNAAAPNESTCARSRYTRRPRPRYGESELAGVHGSAFVQLGNSKSLREEDISQAHHQQSPIHKYYPASSPSLTRLRTPGLYSSPPSQSRSPFSVTKSSISTVLSEASSPSHFASSETDIDSLASFTYDGVDTLNPQSLNANINTEQERFRRLFPKSPNLTQYVAMSSEEQRRTRLTWCENRFLASIPGPQTIALKNMLSGKSVVLQNLAASRVKRAMNIDSLPSSLTSLLKVTMATRSAHHNNKGADEAMSRSNVSYQRHDRSKPAKHLIYLTVEDEVIVEMVEIDGEVVARGVEERKPTLRSVSKKRSMGQKPTQTQGEDFAPIALGRGKRRRIATLKAESSKQSKPNFECEQCTESFSTATKLRAHSAKCKRKTEESDEDMLEEQEEEDAGDKTRCICQSTEEDGSEMIRCDECNYWLHMCCLDVTPEDTEGHWLCPNCGPDEDEEPRPLQGQKSVRILTPPPSWDEMSEADDFNDFSAEIEAADDQFIYDTNGVTFLLEEPMSSPISALLTPNDHLQVLEGGVFGPSDTNYDCVFESMYSSDLFGFWI